MLTILFAPLFGCLFAALFAFRKKALIAALVPILCLCVALISALSEFSTLDSAKFIDLSDWITAGSLRVGFGFMLDGVNIVMVLVVLVVSLLVHIYAVGYMSCDAGFNKFFSFLSAFVFSMLFLVMSDNFLGLFVGWEGVGLCSWMLIGFWYHKNSASFAANEAFIMNRIADLGLLLGIFLIFNAFGSLRFEEVFARLDSANPATVTLIAALLFIGAMGKSAQFPLHTWLADAMEGPTPVSALIHAATMVTAGVYLVIRAHPIYELAAGVGAFIAHLGAFVAIFAASMALVNRDLKRIIAYSTLSQLGYMFVAAGLGYYAIALFHLMTHAFFKALLFLGAGNVMHAMDERLDITAMGGLFKPLKCTAILMTIASVALCGIYPFAGFFSKDKILEVAFSSGVGLWAALLFGAFLSAFYSFRLLMLVFFAPKNHDAHPHEAPKFMLLSMLPLGILAIVAGFFEHPFFALLEGNYLPSKNIPLDHSLLIWLILAASGVALAGIIAAIFAYKNGLGNGLGFTEKIKFLREDSWLFKLLFNQYYIPRIYEAVFMRPYRALGEFFWRKIDLKIIDLAIDCIAALCLFVGDKSRATQKGNLSQSLIFMVAGIFGLLLILLLI